jgi:hypothetical protein
LKSRLTSKETGLDSNIELQKQMQATIDGLTLTEEANNRTIKELRNKHKELLDSIHNQTKTEEINYRMMQELLDKQKQTVKCLTQHKDVSIRKIEAITFSE